MQAASVGEYGRWSVEQRRKSVRTRPRSIAGAIAFRWVPDAIDQKLVSTE